MEVASEGLRGTERGGDGQEESGSHAGAQRSVRVRAREGWRDPECVGEINVVLERIKEGKEVLETA